MKKTVSKRRLTLGYTRVSTSEQIEGTSLDSQRAKVEMLAALVDREPLADVLVDDGYSAGSLVRPAMSTLIARIKADEVSAVLVSKLDRLTRKLADLLYFVDLCTKHDVAIVSAGENVDTSTAAGRMFVQMLGMFAEFERETIKERTTEGRNRKRLTGKSYVRVAPFGYERSGDNLIEVPREQKALARMRKLRADELSYGSIAETLNSERFRNRAGGKFTMGGVHSVLNSKKATGK